MSRRIFWLQIWRAPDIFRILIASASIFAFLSAATAAGLAEQIRSAAVAADGKSILFHFIDGRSQSATADDSATTFGPPRLSSDHLTAGWMELRFDGGSYASPVGVGFYARGRRISLGCDGGAPAAWRFDDPNNVVLKCAFPHGHPSTSLQRIIISTGKLVGRVELTGEDDIVPPTAPPWAKGKFDEGN